MMKFLMYLLFIASPIFFFSNCQSGNPSENSENTSDKSTNSKDFTDPRDGEIYSTIQIGNQVWFSTNLRFKTDSSWNYLNEVKNDKTLGRLYAWNQALTACPKGWHLPTKKEWEILVAHYSNVQNLESEGNQVIYKALFENGESKVNLSLSGFYNSAVERFTGIGNHGSYWSSDKFGLQAAMCALMTLNDLGEGYFMFAPGSQDAGHACRCVED